jgi:NTE family protein
MSHAVTLNLALQGGGAHGAYTWGVLDALLAAGESEDRPDGATPVLAFEGLSGSSAGAVNAVVLADGWLKGEAEGIGGRAGARRALARFWTVLGQQMPAHTVDPLGLGLISPAQGAVSLGSAGRLLASWASQFSPAQINPLDLNPLRDLLAEQIDFEALRQRSPFKLFIGATQVNTAKLRVFREHELSVEVLLASACLPRIHRTVMIDGEPYWDGGYSANPAVYPLFHACRSSDVLLVLLNPLRRSRMPQSAAEIETRIVELGFNTHFMREMRMFASLPSYSLFNTKLERRLRAMRFHMIGGSELESMARSESKLLPYAPFLQHLHAQGQGHARDWLKENAAHVGRRSSIDVQALFA